MNRIPNKKFNGKNPLEIIRNTSTNLEHLRVFGYTYYVHLQEHPHNKLETRACIFIVYPYGKKGYICYDPEKKKFHCSRDVKFL